MLHPFHVLFYYIIHVNIIFTVLQLPLSQTSAAIMELHSDGDLNVSDPAAQDSMRFMQAGEPAGGWKKATMQWGIAWHAYIYTLSAVNGLLIIWTIANLIYICLRGRNLISRKYLLTLNVMVLVFATTKCLFYTIDPRSVNGVMPRVLGSILINTSFPTLTVGFFLLYVALKQCSIASSQLLPLILQTRCIVFFTVICFAVSYFTDVLVVYVYSLYLMMLVCQVFYILSGIVFFSLFSVLFYQYHRAVLKARRKMERTCYRKGHCRRGFSTRHVSSIPVSIKICCVSAILFLVLAVLNVMMILFEFGQIKNSSQDSALRSMCNKYRQVWPFFIYHMLVSVTEQLMALTLALAGTQPFKWFRLTAVRMPGNTIVSSASQLPLPSDSSLYVIGQSSDTCFTSYSTAAIGSTASTPPQSTNEAVSADNFNTIEHLSTDSHGYSNNGAGAADAIT